jgi:hypothetical protein
MLVIHAKSILERNSDNEFSNIRTLLCVCFVMRNAQSRGASAVPDAKAAPGTVDKGVSRSDGG